MRLTARCLVSLIRVLVPVQMSVRLGCWCIMVFKQVILGAFAKGGRVRLNSLPTRLER